MSDIITVKKTGSVFTVVQAYMLNGEDVVHVVVAGNPEGARWLHALVVFPAAVDHTPTYYGVPITDPYALAIIAALPSIESA